MRFRLDFAVLYALLALNVLVFVLMQLPGFEFLQLAGPLWPLEHPRYQYWQWLSHMFLHANFTHLLFNMVVLCSFAPMLLLRFGQRRFLLLYLLCGLAGALLYTGWNEYLIANGVRNVAEQIGLDEATVRSALLSGGLPNVPDGLATAFYTHLLGASGAVFGVLAAFALCFPDAPLTVMFLPMRIKAKYLVPVAVGYELFAQFGGVSLFGDNIAHLAHVGGAVCGALLAWYWLSRREPVSFTDSGASDFR